MMRFFETLDYLRTNHSVRISCLPLKANKSYILARPWYLQSNTREIVPIRQQRFCPSVCAKVKVKEDNRTIGRPEMDPIWVDRHSQPCDDTNRNLSRKINRSAIVRQDITEFHDASRNTASHDSEKK